LTLFAVNVLYKLPATYLLSYLINLSSSINNLSITDFSY